MRQPGSQTQSRTTRTTARRQSAGTGAGAGAAAPAERARLRPPARPPNTQRSAAGSVARRPRLGSARLRRVVSWCSAALPGVHRGAAAAPAPAPRPSFCTHCPAHQGIAVRGLAADRRSPCARARAPSPGRLPGLAWLAAQPTPASGLFATLLSSPLLSSPLPLTVAGSLLRTATRRRCCERRAPTRRRPS